MSHSVVKIILLLSVPLLLLGLSGCANRTQPGPGKEYQEIMKRQKKIAMAKQEEERTGEPSEVTAGGYETLGDQYLSQGNHDLAFIQYAKSVRLKPDQPTLRYKMGGLFLQKGLYEEARNEFEEVRKARPHHALSYEGIGRTWFYGRDYQKAEWHFGEALRLDPKLWQAHSFLGLLYGQRKEFERAIHEYEMAIALKPDAPMLFNNLGMSLFLKGDPERAVGAFTDALRLKNADRRIYNNLGLALSKLGRYPEAIEAFRKGGDEESALHHLRLIYGAGENNLQPRKTIEISEKRTEAEPSCYFAAHKSPRRAIAAVVPLQHP